MLTSMIEARACVVVACDRAYGLLRFAGRGGYLAMASYMVPSALSVVSSFSVRARVVSVRLSLCCASVCCCAIACASAMCLSLLS